MSKRKDSTEDAEVEWSIRKLPRTDNPNINIRMLSIAVFGPRPNEIQKTAAEYIFHLEEDPTLDKEEFVRYIKYSHPDPRDIKIADAWENLATFFTGENDGHYVAIEDIVDVSGLVSAFHLERTKSTTVNPTDNGTASSQKSRSPSPPPSPPPPPPPSTNLNSIVLSTTAIRRMKEEFTTNFNAFKGEPWVLSSGIALDDLLATFVGRLNAESSLHSFVMDDVTVVLKLVTDDDDRTEVQSALTTKDDLAMKQLPDIETSYLQALDKRPDEVLRQLQSGWRHGDSASSLPDAPFCDLIQMTLYSIYFAYQKNHFSLPKAKSDSWYMHGIWSFLMPFFNLDEELMFMPGKVHSQASTLRKNQGRSSASKDLKGHVLDGIVACSKSRLELCAIEAVNVDNDQTQMEALSDKRKLAKVMKDMFDTIRRKSNVNVSRDLVVFGIRIAAESALLYTLRQHRGRFYQLTCVAAISFPPEWDAQGDYTSNILVLISVLLQFKQQMVTTARNIKTWTKISLGAPSIPISHDDANAVVATLMTPTGSPRPSSTA
ncbi:hypothetical protein BGX31_002805 [Mortierella sp. GBA43]|nr:hypothetical protein BGX31_002805 [Mortierella sp. GBA43]